MKNLINGERVDAVNGAIIELVNPATGEYLDTVPNSTMEDVDRAVSIAKSAQKRWEKVPMHERGRILEKYVEVVEHRKESLARLLSNETGKTIKEARAEIGNVRTLVMGYVEKAKHLYGMNIPGSAEQGSEKTIQYTVRVPMGVVAAIIPFNFPVDLFGHKVPSALIMGNAVIVKPSSYNPLTILTLCDILMEVGIPAGVVQCITGNEVTGQSIASHSGIDFISLTGSTETGIQTMSNASKNLTHLSLELSGNDAFILLEDGAVDLAVEEAIKGRMYNAGQACFASKRFLVHNSIKEQFVSKVKERLTQIKMGMPSEETTDMGCLINVAAAIRVEKQVSEMVGLGAKIVCGGQRTGAFYTPTILNDVAKDMPVAKDMEILGPVISVIGFDSEEEAINIANQSSLGLGGAVFSRNFARALNIAERLECGNVVINGSSSWRSAEMPFGGWKMSGIGSEGISSTLEEVSKQKTVVLKNILR